MCVAVISYFWGQILDLRIACSVPAPIRKRLIFRSVVKVWVIQVVVMVRNLMQVDIMPPIAICQLQGSAVLWKGEKII